VTSRQVNGGEKLVASNALATADGERLLDVAVEAAHAAAAVIRARASDVGDIVWRMKRPADFVSEVDTDAEHRIREVVERHVPGAVVVGEELSPQLVAGEGITFIADPLDGTTNFLHGYPWYAVSIGVLANGRLEAGVVLDVPKGDLFTARRGAGAHRNERPIAVSRNDDPSRALIGTGFPFKNPELLDGYQRQFAAVMSATAGIRRAGSAALDLCDVACGRFEAFWELMLAPWDIAAGVLIVREAGGIVTDLEGRHVEPAHTAVVAGSAAMHHWLLARLIENR
jgi:myo-inositol-1(or 4)-monophosphatase